jgi:HK97 family phage portal protein
VRIFGLTITRQKAAVPTADAGLASIATARGFGSWWPRIFESFAGAWQRNITATVDDVSTHSIAWACITLIASDIAKLRLKLLEEKGDICEETENPAYSPVLRDPNHFQNRIVFLKCWVISKLTNGNTYVLKDRDARGVVQGLYVLDPSCVKVLVAPDSSVFYQLSTDYLSGIGEPTVTVPASEIIHDIHIPFYHPLIGVSPIHACGRAVLQGLKILQNTETLFENGSQPGGVLTAPHSIGPDAAERIQQHWDQNFGGANNAGKVAVLGDGLHFEPLSMTAVDAQLIDQLKWGDERVCATFHVPGYMVGVGPLPSYNNIEALQQQYYSQCLQELMESIELCLQKGLRIAEPLYVEMDLDGLLRMDSATKMDTAVKGVRGGIYTPNEARQMFNKKRLVGGDTVYLQDQDHALEWLAKRDAMPIEQKPAPALPPAPQPAAAEDEKAFDYSAFRQRVMKRIETLYAAA